MSVKKEVLLAAVVLLLLALAACGPAAPAQVDEADGATTSPVVRGDDDGGAEEVVAEPGVAVDPQSVTVDSDGIEVGYTADGYPYRGNPNAEVVIEEFSDYQCPFCSRFHAQTLPGLTEQFIANGDVLFIYRDFPLEAIHPQARAAAVAARCAGAQGADTYWRMHDALFVSLGEWSVSDPTPIFVSMADGLDLDTEAFAACLAEPEHNAAVTTDLNEGSQRGVRGTPAFFINGSLLSGAQPLTAFQQAIARAQGGADVAAEPGGASTADQSATAPIAAPTPVAFQSGDFAAAIGNPDAPVTIVEFTDYQCPFCARHSSETMPEILARMVDTGEVYYVLKDLPLDGLHPKARDAAVAARCAGDQDAYWEMHDVLFADQAAWAEPADTAAALTQLAAGIGLDSGAFGQCLASGKYDAAVQAHVDEATRLQVNSTPFFFIDGYPLSGARPYENFRYVVDLALEDGLADAIVEALEAQRAAQAAQAAQQQQQAAQPSGPVDVPIGDAPALGDPNAPITLIEYTDYQCPFCLRHHQETYPSILSEYVETGQVRYVYKDFPLTTIHPQAFQAAEAARCARDQGAFFEMHERLFTAQSEWSNANSRDIFVGYAGEFGLDVDEFASCLDSGKHADAVQAELDEAIALGLRGTPAFFVNGYFVNGAQPYSVFVDAFEALSEAE